MPIYDELWNREDRIAIPGGSALNSIRATNFMLKDSNSGLAHYIGCIGKDERGEHLKTIMKTEGVDACMHEDDSVPTGTCAVIVYEKDRTMCANIAAAAKYPTSHVDSQTELLEKVSHVYTTGFFITSNAEALMKIAKYCNDNDKTFGFNLSAPFCIQFYTAQVMEAIEHAQYIFMNEDEAATFLDVHKLDKDQGLKAVAMHIAKHKKNNTSKPRRVIITQQAEPIIVATHTDGQEEAEIKEYPIEKLNPEQVVDSNGAGDSLVGGFYSQLSLGKDFDTAIRAGIYLSREVVQKPGCTFPDSNTFQ